MDATTPRVNSAMLKAFDGQVVRLVGKVLQISPGSVLLEASDKGHVQIECSNPLPIQSQYIEIIGRAQASKGSLMAFTMTNLGDVMDLNAYNQMVELTPKFPAIFSDKS
ncbi:replication factor A protein 3 [Ramicandelaber brevisporus]|nr:replication factor A protein 3 [Ramicandelaber brevisporus]KAI8873948.1 replication factor A protein 3 [Ramicandelaber brevisporus]